MGLNVSQTGRARADALGQQELPQRVSVRTDSAVAVIYSAGGTESPRIRRMAVSRPALSGMARQAVQVSSAAVLPPKAMAIATLSIRQPVQPRAAQSPECAQAPATMSGTPHPAVTGASAKAVRPQHNRPEPGTHLRTDKEVRAMKAFLAAEAARSLPAEVKNFTSVWAERHEHPMVCEKFLEYAELDFPEIPHFLRALDDLRAAPSVDKAESMLRDFVQEAQIDDFGIPLPGQSKWQLNFSSQQDRRKTVDLVSQRIAEARSAGSSPDRMQSLVDAFGACENQFITSLARNCKFQTDVNALKR